MLAIPSANSSLRPLRHEVWRYLCVALLFVIAPSATEAVEKSYRFYRFHPDALRNSPSTANSIQLSEFEFRLRGSKVSMAGVTVSNPSGNNPNGEGPASLIDGNTATKWLDFNKGGVVFAFPARTVIDGYNFATANDSPERDPVNWRLEGSEDGSSWIRIDEVSSAPITTARFTYQSGFELPADRQVPGDPFSPQWHPSELLNWNPATDPNAPYNRSTVPLAARLAATASLKVNPHARANEARVMPLMAFNTIPTASAQGSRTMRYLTPMFWQYMHAMTFWGGSDRDTRTIQAPSAHIVDAAHRNGVPVLGKIFFAFSSEATRLAYVRDFLQKSGSTFPVADKLIEVADYYGFDGWFINQETSGTNSTDSQNMRDLIKYLRARAPHLHIMWYDAMVESGARSFQNALTTQNDGFLKENGSLVSHSMFLNFWWGSAHNDSTKLPDSRQLALNLGLDPYDVYAGIDTEGGGIYTTGIDWANLFPEGQPHRLSLGIYRPEWTFNSTNNPGAFHARDMEYWIGPNGDPSNTTSTASWKGIAHYIPETSAITQLPFVTNFNVGRGERFAINGTTLMTGPWNNLSVQDHLPTWRWIVQSTGTRLTPSFHLDDAYYGATSLMVAGTLDATNDLKLYRCSLPMSSNTTLRIVFKRGIIAASNMQVGVAFTDNPNTFEYLDVGNATSTGWNTRNFSLTAYQGRTITAIALRFASAAPVASYNMKVGQIAIYNGAISTPQAPSGVQVERQETLDADTQTLRLRWTHSPSPVRFYNVFLRNPDNTQVWLGATPNNAYYVPFARRKGSETTLRIEVEAVAPDFGVSSRAQVIAPMPASPNTRFAITGTIIGTPGAWNNGNTTRERVFDGNTSTYFDAPDPDGAWAGLDLGAGNERVITALRYYPRSGWSWRMPGGVFQASNTPDFTGPDTVTIGAIAIQPVEGTYTTLGVNHPTPFRYLRYLAPNGAHGNVAEVQFFGVRVPAAPASVTGRMIDGQATLTWAAPSFAGTYTVKRSSSGSGPFQAIATDLTSTSFVDSNLAPAGTYYYVISASNEAGTSGDSAIIAVSDGYAQWLTQQGLTPLAPGTGFAEDLDTDGLANGVEYAAPDGLQVTPTDTGSMITAELRQDNAITPTVLRSFDLKAWAPVTFTLAPDQSGVPAGFSRWQAQDTVSPTAPKRFYKLRLSR